MKQKVRLLYTGLCLSGESVRQRFLKGKEECFFIHIRHPIKGHYYRAEYDPKTKGLQMSRRPEDLGEAEVDQTTIDEWRAKEVAALSFRARARASKKVSATKLYKNKEIWQIQAIAKKLTHAERRAFADRLVDLIVWGDEK